MTTHESQLTTNDLRDWRFPVAIGAMEAFAYIAMAQMPQDFTGIGEWVFFGLLLGALGALVLYAGGHLLTEWKISMPPVILYGMVVLTALWSMIEWLDVHYLGNFYGAPGSMVSAALSAGAVGIALHYAYPAWSKRNLPRWLRNCLAFSLQPAAQNHGRREITRFHVGFVAGFVMFESIFVFLQVVADKLFLNQVHFGSGLHTVAGALTWFILGSVSAGIAVRIVAIIWPHSPLIQFSDYLYTRETSTMGHQKE